ncbi:MAG: DEAD/DEAH box helicase family protein, partial [Bacteroidales bacterium]|nr:DEAD/DEAH box helicase family protein [Bacteroidales bacterium]
TDAADSVVRVFAGQPNGGQLTYKMDKGRVVLDKSTGATDQDLGYFDEGYRNADIAFDDKQLLENIRQIQAENKIHLSNELVNNLGRCQLDVEMEPGTGKTYVYIRTIFELNKNYGWTKFIVVVPSIAIREGVKKSFDITADHFMELYGKKARYFVYNSSNLNQIEMFSQSSDISVMIINVQAFNTSLKEGANNKVARIIYDKRDEFASRRPIDVIAANRPIAILDEPQKMGGDRTQEALKKFNPLFTLNYSATHKEAHNLVYVLDALDAYNQKLVKKIEVVGFELRNLMGTDCYIYLSDIVLAKDSAPRVRLDFEVQGKTGSIRREMRTLSDGDDLYHYSGGMEQYKGYVISEIVVDQYDSSRCCVRFVNGVELGLKECQGNITAEHKARIQIRETIRAHFRKESRLFHRGIKCLSLFFLDQVSNYRLYDGEGNQLLGRYGEIFEEEYEKAMNENLDLFDEEYTKYLSGISPSDTHAGYFSIDKKGHSIDSELKRGSDISDDISAYDLILKNKERLLSFDEPVRFIFSHSALREGWDNPNVFQICSLRDGNSTTQKRQEVGRGMRLCVNDLGVRQDIDTLADDVHNINKLTVVASESYASFADGLQREIGADLYDRPTKANSDFFFGKTIIVAGQKHTFTKEEADEIHHQLRNLGYVSKSGEPTAAFREAADTGKLALLEEELGPYSKQVFQLVQSVYDPSALGSMIEDASKPIITQNKLNGNFDKEEFKELWKRINHKFAYAVDFDSEELIGKAVTAIDAQLVVSKLSYVLVRGVQGDNASFGDVKNGDLFNPVEKATKTVETDVVTHVKYDLLGKIVSGTRLTRRTIAQILSRISPAKFDMYKLNPEEFIQKVTRFINEQKATIIVEHIGYHTIEGEYDSSIFTQEKHTSLDKAYKGKKHILDYVFTDGNAKVSVERQFVDDLEKSVEVVVYAKLPKGFHIPTPVGNYSPDWAIAFQEGSVKHVYFVAETKGSMSTLELREIERCKIDCAKKLFDQLSTDNVKYGQVSDFSTLLSLVR